MVKYVALESAKLVVQDKEKTIRKGVLYDWDVFVKVYREYFEKDGDLDPIIHVILDCGDSLVPEEDMFLYDLNNIYSRGPQ